MSIKILNQEEGIKLLSRLLYEHNLIPIFGAGFTRGCKSYKETVPDGQMTTELMKNLILENCSQLEESELNSCDFNDMSKYFYEFVPTGVRNVFFRNYFTEVEITDHRKELLQLSWPYAYTLNVDDGIERTLQFQAVLPYKNLNRPDNSIKLLFKLHGDAFTEVTYKTDENIIFSHDQYLLSITSEQNSDILNHLKGDFSQKNLLFIGCSLINEPDIKYIFRKADTSSDNTYRILLRSKKPTFKEETDLKQYGINQIILIDNYELFYRDFVRSVQKLEIENEITDYKFKNPQVTITLTKEEALNYLSGARIFDDAENVFYKGGMQVNRSCITQIESQLEKNDCVVIKGRRFSGKTSLISALCERQKKYSIYFFPSTSLVDEQLIYQLLHNKQDVLFLFDSNSLSVNTYKLIANSYEILRKRKNKIVIAINSNDNFIMDSLHSRLIEISNVFDQKELNENIILSNKYGLISRYKRHTNIDYIKKLSDEQRVNIPYLTQPPHKMSLSERVIILLLCAIDKLFVADAIALGISITEINDLLKRFPLFIEEIKVEPGEATTHSATKLVHNSKLTLLSFLRSLDNKEIIECILHIVKKLKKDRARFRIYIEVILFDTLNQLFGGKKGAGKLIFEVYQSLESELNDSLHYWLQRAKSIYRLLPMDKSQLEKAYSYAKKAYNDGWSTMRAKAALTTALICCLLSELETDIHTKNEYKHEAILLAHEAVFSNHYKYNTRYLNSELKGKGDKRRLSSYDLIRRTCSEYLTEKNYSDLSMKAEAIVQHLSNLEEDNRKVSSKHNFQL
ncbi:hypothetical protein AM501_09490 [Aneurinibacillus migulanus]|uniref:SIR2 family protein n=1 Tax=Aneurinibacillus migulanus TaxID=47500 RepID=UPI0005BAA955|nr:SIR2 family protein [Aneurinibacillus migulanus]KIV58965.1 hypothetical protein TS64_04170 [Aneurinibacillus migulanus]KPD08513.1 hypothetical protein AM501_09490 [Aneurinibacillus migulanus]